MRPQPDVEQAEPQPLGPDSMMWRHFGDWRGLLVSLWAGTLQNMHPQLGAAVEQHSRFFDERWQRLFRSTYPIGGVIYDQDRAAQTAREVRDYHRTVKGVDRHGRHYSALNPDVYFWAHATFVMSTVVVAEYFGRPMTRGEKEQIYAEGIEWYAMYGLSMRPVPPDWPAFEAYWDHMCRDVLEVNKAALDVLDITRIAKLPQLRLLPDPLWAAVRRPMTRTMLWQTTGMLHPAVRHKLGLSWSERDERLLRLSGRAVAAGWKLVPFDRRMHPRARDAWRRARGEIPADSPLVETPRRWLPPSHERDKPTHYCPY
jgi:uncharacterized protein (DUF2236 family)